MCDLWDGDGDEPDVWTETWRKARKAHVCASCKRAIEPKEKYLRHFSAHDGSTWEDKLCAECATDREEFAKVPGHFYPVPAELDDALEECIREEPSSAPRWQPMLDRIRGKRAESWSKP